MAHSDTLPRDFGWVLLELMGHRQRVGRAREDEIAGSQMLRIDIPTEGDDYATEFYSASAIYAIRPVSEQIARDHYAARDPRPQRPIDYPGQADLQHQIDHHEGQNDA